MEEYLFILLVAIILLISALAFLLLRINALKRTTGSSADSKRDTYSHLFDNMMHGFIYCKVLYDDRNEAKDYIYISVNDLYEEFTGLRDLVGKKLSDVIPDLREVDPGLFRTIGRVSLSGKPEQFETFVQALGRWYSVSMYSPEKGYFVALVDNITELKQSQEDLALFSSIVTSSDDAILSKTLDGKITTWNKSAERIFGYTKSEIIGKHVSILIPEDRQDEEPLIIDKISRGERVEHYETQRIRKDGSRLYISLTVSPIIDINGIIIGASKIARDITEKRSNAEKLEASEKRFRALIENSYDAIVLSDLDSRILYQSPSVLRILGYSPSERLGRSLYEFLHPDDKETFATLYSQVTASGPIPISFQYRFRRKDDAFIWLEGVVTNRINDPNVKAIVANYRDVTVRKDAQESLELMLSRFQQAEQIAHLGHWETNLSTQRTRWSDETFNILQIEPGSVEPTEELYFRKVHPEDLEMVKETIVHARATFSPFSLYHRIITESRQIRVLFVVGRFELDKLNNPFNLYGILLDVTELSEKEQKLIEAKKDLETFIYKSSHDLRSPITSILGLINVAKADINDRKSLTYFNKVHEVVLRQNKMLLNLINVTTISERKLVIQSFTGSDLVNAAYVSLKTIDRFSEASIKVIGAGEKMNTDFDLCKIILCQILENSLNYSKDQVNITIEFFSIGHGSKAIVVSDDGLGIPPQCLESVFEMFFRASDLSTGSGLGLYLVKKSIEKLGGEVTVSSVYGRGSKFSASIPDLNPL